MEFLILDFFILDLFGPPWRMVLGILSFYPLEMMDIKVGSFEEKSKEFQLDNWTVGQLDSW